MEIPEKLSGELQGAFFRTPSGTYTFMGYGTRTLEEGRRFCEESFGYRFIKQISGINAYFFHVANSFAEEKLNKKTSAGEKINISAEDIMLEDIIRHAGNGNGS